MEEIKLGWKYIFKTIVNGGNVIDSLYILTGSQGEIIKSNINALINVLQERIKETDSITEEDMRIIKRQAEVLIAFLGKVEKKQKIGSIKGFFSNPNDKPIQDIVSDLKNLFASWIGRVI